MQANAAQDVVDSRRENLIGSLWMILAMLGFAMEDSLLKVATSQLPVSQVLLCFGAVALGVLVLIARFQGARLWTPETRTPAMQIRMGFEIFGRLFFILAITTVPLSVVTVILQVTPLVVVACAAVVFGERVGVVRAAAILIGFVGVLVVLQPGADQFTWSALLAVLGMIGFAGRDITSRVVPRGLSAVVLGVYGYLGVVVAGIVYVLWEQQPFVWPDGATAQVLVAAAVVGVLAYTALMKAMRTGEVSAVAPFRYSRLLIGIALGVLWFGETLRPEMMLGSALIVCAGLTLLWARRR